MGESATKALADGLRIAAERGWGRLLIHSLLASGRHTRPEVLDAPLLSLVNTLLDGSPIREIHLLARDEAERAILHEKILRIIQGHA